MENKVHILTPNKNTSRFFGVDFFARLCTGYNDTFRFYSTSIDFNAVYRNEIVTMPDVMLDSLKIELSNKAKNSIIGISQNPDIYQARASIKPILDILDQNDMGLYLETNSPKLIGDIEFLKEFSDKHPLLVAVPVSGEQDYGNPDILPEASLFGNIKQTMLKLADKQINFGVLLKPVIPYLNDGLKDFTKTVTDIIQAKARFIYPSFSLHFDSGKLKAFYDKIDRFNPELKNRYSDHYGHKYSWMSNKTPDLKKEFVILCRKDKVLFSMKDIINSYKPDMEVQMKLF